MTSCLSCPAGQTSATGASSCFTPSYPYTVTFGYPSGGTFTSFCAGCQHDVLVVAGGGQGGGGSYSRSGGGGGGGGLVRVLCPSFA